MGRDIGREEGIDVRKKLGLMVATVALVGNVFVASPAQAWTCATNDEVIPPEVGGPACEVVLTVAGTVCRVVPKACFY